MTPDEFQKLELSALEYLGGLFHDNDCMVIFQEQLGNAIGTGDSNRTNRLCKRLIEIGAIEENMPNTRGEAMMAKHHGTSYSISPFISEITDDCRAEILAPPPQVDRVAAVNKWARSHLFVSKILIGVLILVGAAAAVNQIFKFLENVGLTGD